MVLVAVIGAIRRQTTKNKAAAADRPNCLISFPIFTAIFISFLIFHHVFFFLFAWISMQLLIFDDIFMSFLKIKLLPLTDQTALFLFPFLLQFSSFFLNIYIFSSGCFLGVGFDESCFSCC